MKNVRDIIIIGGGAAGMIAAIAAKRKGSDVLILEKNERVGRKILSTGNGRCNLTNTNIDISKYHGKHPEFIFGPFSRFGYEMTIDFFKDIGIFPKIEDEGKVFPMSLQASSVLDALRYELEDLKVEISCGKKAVDIKFGKWFEVYTEDGDIYKGRKLILASGGKASPDLGSDGSGFLLAEKIGHTIIPPFPALVQVKLDAKFLKALMGVKFEGSAEVISDGKTLRSESGEILFTEYGISGPPILQLSRIVNDEINKGKSVYIKVEVMNDMSEEEIDEYLLNRFLNRPKRPLQISLIGFLNKKLIPVILKESQISDINKPAGNVTKEERKKISNILKDWRIKAIGTNPWPSAQVTAGGVDVSEINNKTMESKIVKGLYFAGEIVDIDGDCGGYNLQWAWSSGHVAGESAADSLKF